VKPFRDGAVYSEFVNCDAPVGTLGRSLIGCKGYQERGAGSLGLSGADYAVHLDPTDDQAAAAAPPEQGASAMRFGAIAPGLFVVQIDMRRRGGQR
jgi:hypothetical protein